MFEEVIDHLDNSEKLKIPTRTRNGSTWSSNVGATCCILETVSYE